MKLYAVLLPLLAGYAVVLGTEAKVKLEMTGAFVEGCSCEKTCTFEVSGVDPKCHSLGGYRIDKGTFGGKDISGTKIAFVVVPGGDVYEYYDAPTTARAKAAQALAKKLFDSYGHLAGCSPAKIALSGNKGNMKLKIEGVGELTSKPVMGGDGKTPVLLNNVYGDPYDSIFQAQVVSASVSIPDHAFQLKGTSSFYLDHLRVSKKL